MHAYSNACIVAYIINYVTVYTVASPGNRVRWAQQESFPLLPCPRKGQDFF